MAKSVQENEPMTQLYTNVNVNIQTADAGPGGWIAYAMATWIAWAFLVGYVDGNALLYMACISLACTIPYLTAAATQLKLGNVAGGVTWLYFGSFFAFCSALTYGVTYFSGIYGWPLDGRILGFMWIVIGILLICTTPVFLRYAPSVGGIAVIGADVGIVGLALIYLGYATPMILQVSGWAFFVASVGGMWMAIWSILGAVGIKFPMTQPLIK
jgi:hypothetical protein